MRLRFATTGLLLLLLSAGCKEQYTPQTGPEINPGPPLRVLPEIRVLDAGMTPQQPLRYSVEPGQTESVVIELARARAAQAGESGVASVLPPVQLEVQFGPAEATPQGWVRQPVQVTRVRLSQEAEQMSPVEREQLQKELAPLLNVRGWTDMDMQGRIRRSEFQAIADVSPRIRTLLGNIRTALITVPLPEQPVGVRARWEVDRELELSGVDVKQTVTYQLMERDADTLKLQITARQSAEPQAISGGRVEAYEASIIGSATVRLEQLVPYSEAESNSHMRISASGQGQPELIRVEGKTAVRVSPVDSARPGHSIEIQ